MSPAGKKKFVKQRPRGSGRVLSGGRKPFIIYTPPAMADWYLEKSVELLRANGLPDRDGKGNRNWLISEELRLFMENYKMNRIGKTMVADEEA